MQKFKKLQLLLVFKIKRNKKVWCVWKTVF